jgi:uncharacterized protein YebE (UPF0316 family)
VDTNLWLALAVFVLRIANNALGTMRFILISRQRQFPAAVLAFIESVIFAFTAANVIRDLTDPIMLTAYSGGFAIGSYVGMALEQRFVRSFVTVNVISPVKGHEIALALRDAGFGVTETVGEGKDGLVTMLRAIVDRRDSPHASDIVRDLSPDAFIAMEETRAIRQGYFRRPNGKGRRLR